MKATYKSRGKEGTTAPPFASMLSMFINSHSLSFMFATAHQALQTCITRFESLHNYVSSEYILIEYKSD